MRFILSVLFFFFYTGYAYALINSFKAPVVVTATVTSTQVLAANNLRTYLIIMNQGSSVNVIVKFGSVQSAGEGVVIPPGGAYEPLLAPGNSVWLESASSTSAVTLIEGQ
jgi:hypothetical protein